MSLEIPREWAPVGWAVIGWTALPPLEFWGVADKEFYFLSLKITYRNTVEENPHAAVVAWKQEQWHAADLGRLGEENLGIWHHEMKIPKSSALPCVGIHSSMEGECISGVSGMPQQFQPCWPLPPLGHHIPLLQWDGFAGFNLQKWVYTCAS